MKNIKKGDIVTRSSYKNDIVFYVDRIVKTENRGKIAILKGITLRIIADSPIDDLVLKNDKIVQQRMKFDYNSNYKKINFKKFGKILHLDGDINYSLKTEKYYRSKGLNSIVKHVSEYRQPIIINSLLNKYQPDILVITGHDGMIKNNKNFNDLENYRNSKYFVNSVIQARKWNNDKNSLIIFAGACQSYYEMLINAGANFASSPARILIDFKDPLIVAEEIAVTRNDQLVLMSDLEKKISNGRRAINGIGAVGKFFVI